MLEALAPFVTEGGTVEVKGEDFDCAAILSFDGSVMSWVEQSVIRNDELRELREKAERLEEAETLLRRFNEAQTPQTVDYSIPGDIAAYLKRLSPLEQLAGAAE
jgi:hypothetical protein